MRATFEPEDIDGIAKRVVELLQPLLCVPQASKDEILDKDGLAEYLNVESHWIYQKVSERKIPYFKMGKYLRFRKSQIDKWLDAQKVEALRPLKGRPR